MTIQEAQDMIKTIPDYCMWDVKFNDAEEVIRQAIKNGYQLCKVDEVIAHIQVNRKNNSADCVNAEAIIDAIKEACE